MNIFKIFQHFFRFLHPAKCSQSNSKSAKDIKDSQSRLNYFCRVALAKDNKFYARTKHIDLCYHFVCEVVEDGKIKMEYIPTSENMADSFIKGLAKPKFQEFVGMPGLAIMKAWRMSTSLFQDKQGWPYQELSHDQCIHIHLHNECLAWGGVLDIGLS